MQLAVVYAIRRAIKGAIYSLWVPPAATFIITISAIALSGSSNSPWPFWESALRGFLACIALTGLGFFMGALGLVFVGIPTLFVLTLLRISHPLIVCVVAAAFTYWRLTVTPLSHREDAWLILGIADLTAVVAALYARSNPSFKRTGLRPAA